MGQKLVIAMIIDQIQRGWEDFYKEGGGNPECRGLPGKGAGYNPNRDYVHWSPKS